LPLRSGRAPTCLSCFIQQDVERVRSEGASNFLRAPNKTQVGGGRQVCPATWIQSHCFWPQDNPVVA
jgi:hypothetical protein